MTDKGPIKRLPDGTPNLLDFPARDPVQETFRGRWKQLPKVQKTGVVVVLTFGVAFPAAMFLGANGDFQPLVAGFCIAGMGLGAFMFVLSRFIR